MDESAATTNGSRPLSPDAKRYKSTPDPDELALPSSSVSLRYTSTVKSFPIKDDDLLRNIFSFVGEYHYRFVGGVNRTFQRSYLTLYPNKNSYFNASTVELSKYCWNDIEACRYIDTNFTLRSLARCKLWHSAARHGSIDSVKYLLQHFDRFEAVTKKNAEREAKANEGKKFDRNRIESGDPLIYEKIDFRNDLCFVAAKHGRLHLIKWACTKNIGISKDDERVCKYAIGGGHIDTFLWAKENGFAWNRECMKQASYAAAKNGHLKALQWVHNNGYDLTEIDTDSASFCHSAAEGGHVEVLKWLHSIGCNWNEETIRMAIICGQSEAVRLMLGSGCEVRKQDACVFAALVGNVEILSLLRSVDCEWDDSLPAYAAAHGYIDVIEWAVKNGCPWSESSCQHAAGYGQLATLKWLRSNGCTWDEKTTTYASSHIIYTWAVENGCPVSPGNPRDCLQSDFERMFWF